MSETKLKICHYDKLYRTKKTFGQMLATNYYSVLTKRRFINACKTIDIEVDPNNTLSR